MLKGIPWAKSLFAFIAAMGVFALTGRALAVDGQPEPWQLGMLPAASPIAEQIQGFWDLLLYLISAIVLFVLALLGYVMIRFRESANPTPSKTSHNTLLEVLWTVIPILILFAIAIPSFRLLYAQYDFPKFDLTIKAIGSQWYWTYEYPDHGDLTFDSVMLEDDELKPGQPRLLAVDNEVVVPVNKNVHVLVTAMDVIHSWWVPSFGVKVDAVPGRILSTWFRANETGVFYGMCAELCGTGHSFMPITVRVVAEEEFNAWLNKAKLTFGSIPKRLAKNLETETSKHLAELGNQPALKENSRE